MLEIFFSGPAISCLLIAGSAAFGVSVVLRYLPDKRRLEHTMSRAEAALTKLRREIAEREATIAQLQSEVNMLKPLYTRLNAYHEQLTELRVEAERQELVAEEAEADDDDDGIAARRRRPRI